MCSFALYKMSSNLNVKFHVALNSTSLDNLLLMGANKPFSLVKIVTLIIS